MKQHTSFITIPLQQNLVDSIDFMNQQQVNINLVQINLTAENNDQILQWLQKQMKDIHFYSQSRYMLARLHQHCKEKQKNKRISQIGSRFDISFVNGFLYNQNNLSEQQLGIIGENKQKRALTISFRQQFVNQIDQLSRALFYVKQENEKQAFFFSQLGFLNKTLMSNICMLNENNAVQQYNLKNLDSFLYLKQKNKWKQVILIDQQNCKFFKTKNRNPILLDFTWAKYIYKNDNQLSHQLIAMKLIQFFNKMFSKQIIMQYQICPEIVGAFYQFVENAETICTIKKNYKNHLIGYLNLQSTNLHQIEKQTKIKQFADSYAGFCFIQYVLDLKDRNNENIMVTHDGRIFHIDLAFIFEANPGGIRFQTAPFKMTDDYLQVLGDNLDSDYFKYFESVLINCFTKFFIYQQEFFYKIAILSCKSSQIRCFEGFKLQKYRQRFPKSLQEIKDFVQGLIQQSYNNWKTKKYDSFQFSTNDILP